MNDEAGEMYMIGRGVDSIGFPDLPAERTNALIDCPQCGDEGPHQVLRWPGGRRSLRCFKCDKEW